MILTRIVTWGLLAPLYATLGVVGYWWFVDTQYPVNEQVELEVLDRPFVIDSTSIIKTRSTVIKRRSCPTERVQYYLADSAGNSWTLIQHGGQQREEGEHIYIRSMDWPISARYGTYRVCKTVVSNCNPLRSHVEKSCSEDFTIR